jgi:hypothetical protein
LEIKRRDDVEVILVIMLLDEQVSRRGSAVMPRVLGVDMQTDGGQ